MLHEQATQRLLSSTTYDSLIGSSRMERLATAWAQRAFPTRMCQGRR
jgi:hypothetical protein